MRDRRLSLNHENALPRGIPRIGKFQYTDPISF